MKQQTLELDNTSSYKDNQKRAELGAIAPSIPFRPRAEMKSAEQDVVTQESQVLQQELLLKSVLTRERLRQPRRRLARASFPPTTSRLPAQDPIIPIQDLVPAGYAEPARGGS